MEIYQNNLNYINSLFLNKPSNVKRGFEKKGMKLLLNRLGNPQDKVKTIHIAGTSGKGSTCYILSTILVSQGFKVGLTLSPFVLDIRERVQINNNLISKSLFNKYWSEIQKAISETSAILSREPSFFNIMMALAFYTFYKEKVDYAVIETGIGGVDSSTNVISNTKKISIITKIGLDHTKLLGKTLSHIAQKKAGIILPNSVVFTVKQNPKVLKIIDAECKKQNAVLNIVDKKIFQKIGEKKFSFNYNGLLLPKVHIGLQGDYQFQNASSGLACVRYLSSRDKFSININSLLKSIDHLSFLGRFTVKQIGNKTVIFDGAHNPQKMKYFLRNLKILYPSQKYSFLIGCKYSKEYTCMLKIICKYANNLYLTKLNLDNYNKIPIKTISKQTIQVLKNINFTKLHEDAYSAFEALLATKNADIVVVTGSLYLLSEIFKDLRMIYNV